jgi:hypothetical protein
MSEQSADAWELNPTQVAFMNRHLATIQDAYEHDDMNFLRALEATDEYRQLFGRMSWDEAWDRYEETELL